jgi:hypothetical protein
VLTQKLKRESARHNSYYLALNTLRGEAALSKNDPPDRSPRRPPRDCTDTFKFGIDQITTAGNVERVRALHIGDVIEVRLDENGRAAVFDGDVRLGWPSHHADVLEDCLRKHYRFPGRVVEEGGVAFPVREVQVTGVVAA